MAKSNRHNAPTPLSQIVPPLRADKAPMTKVAPTARRVVRKKNFCDFDLLKEYDLDMVEVRTTLGNLGYSRSQQTLENYFKEYPFLKPLRVLDKEISVKKTIKRKVKLQETLTIKKVEVDKKRRFVASKFGNTSHLPDTMINKIYEQLKNL